MLPAFLPAAPLLSIRSAQRSAPFRIAKCCAGSANLSPRAQNLIQLQVQNPLFDITKPPSTLSSLLSTLQSSNTYLSLSQLPPPQTPSYYAAEQIRIHILPAIDKARATVVEEYPGINQPGGALYPEYRAKACWRDLREFARVVAYGVACEREVFSERGLQIMNLIYEELDVPLPAMKRAIEVVSIEIAKECTENVAMQVERGFAALLEVLEAF